MALEGNALYMRFPRRDVCNIVDVQDCHSISALVGDIFTKVHLRFSYGLIWRDHAFALTDYWPKFLATIQEITNLCVDLDGLCFL